MAIAKETFDRANVLYSEINTLAKNGTSLENDTTGTYSEYNSIVEEHDFTNKVFTGENGKFGIRWCWGGEMVPARYDAVKYMTSFAVPADECLAVMTRGDRDYLVDSHGQEVFEADEIKPNAGSIAPVIFCRNGGWGIAGSNGSVLLEPVFDSIQPDSNGYVFLTLDGKKGLVWGGMTVEPQFDSMDFDASDRLVVTLDGKEGYLDETGAFTADEDEAYFKLDMLN